MVVYLRQSDEKPVSNISNYGLDDQIQSTLSETRDIVKSYNDKRRGENGLGTRGDSDEDGWNTQLSM